MIADFVLGCLITTIVIGVIDFIINNKRRKEILKILAEIKEQNDRFKKQIENIRNETKHV